jgi:hypothetical protein
LTKRISLFEKIQSVAAAKKRLNTGHSWENVSAHFGSSCALGRGTAPVRQYPKGFYVIEAEISLVRAIKQTLNLRLLVTYN